MELKIDIEIHLLKTLSNFDTLDLIVQIFKIFDMGSVPVWARGRWTKSSFQTKAAAATSTFHISSQAQNLSHLNRLHITLLDFLTFLHLTAILQYTLKNTKYKWNCSAELF